MACPLICARGKTCLMFSPERKGKEKARRRYFGDGAQSLCLPDLGVQVPVAGQCKHLGGYVDSRLTMLPEVRYRLAQAHSSLEASQALPLNNSELSISTRAAIFASALTPTFFILVSGSPLVRPGASSTLDTPNL